MREDIFPAPRARKPGGGLGSPHPVAREWRRFTLASRVPVILSAALLARAIAQGTPARVIEDAPGRMVFLASLLALPGIVRVVAAEPPAIAQAGRYLTGQPPGRPIWRWPRPGTFSGCSSTSAGWRSCCGAGAGPRPGRPRSSIREIKLRRVTVATLRGFSLVALWSPFGFGINTLLLAMPGLSYAQIGPPAIAVALLFLAGGWLLDQLTAPPRPAGPRPVGADPADRVGLVRLILHVAALGAAVFAIGAVAGLDFQHALLLAVPLYSLGWAARLGMREPSGPSAAVARVTALTIRRFPLAAPEIAIFASAGLLSVLALEMIPTDRGHPRPDRYRRRAEHRRIVEPGDDLFPGHHHRRLCRGADRQDPVPGRAALERGSIAWPGWGCGRR